MLKRSFSKTRIQVSSLLSLSFSLIAHSISLAIDCWLKFRKVKSEFRRIWLQGELWRWVPGGQIAQNLLKKVDRPHLIQRVKLNRMNRVERNGKNAWARIGLRINVSPYISCCCHAQGLRLILEGLCIDLSISFLGNNFFDRLQAFKFDYRLRDY